MHKSDGEQINPCFLNENEERNVVQVSAAEGGRYFFGFLMEIDENDHQKNGFGQKNY